MVKLGFTKKLVKNKYFLSITLVSFFIILVLTSLVLLTSFTIYKNDVKRKALMIELEKLDSYANQIDAQYNRILMSVEQLVYDKNVLEWIFKKDNYSNPYLLKVILDKMNYVSSSNNVILSLEIYNAKNKAIISNYHGYYAEPNENGFMKARKPIYMGFMSNKNIKQITVVSEKMNNVVTDTIILLSSLTTYNKKGAIGALVEINKLFPQNIGNKENIFIVYSKDPSIYFWNNADSLLLNEDNTDLDFSTLLSEDMDGDIHTLNINGKIYYSAYRNIINNEFKLLMLVSEADIAVNLNSFSIYFGFAFMLILVLSTLCSFLISKIAHEPIKKIVESISAKLGNAFVNKNDARFTDELKYLDSIFNEIISKNSEFEKTVFDYKEFFKENMLRNLIYGKKDEDNNLFSAMDYFNKQVNNFIILVFNIDNQTQGKATYLFKNFDTLVYKNVAQKYDVNYLRTGFMQYTMLINLEKPQEREILIDYIRQLQKSIQEKYESTFTVGISSIRHELNDICLCYDEAQEAVKHKIFYGNNRIIDILHIQNETERSDGFFIYEGQMLIKKLRAEKMSKIPWNLE